MVEIAVDEYMYEKLRAEPLENNILTERSI